MIMKSKKLGIGKVQDVFPERLRLARYKVFHSREEFAQHYDAKYREDGKSIIKAMGKYERGESIPSISRLFQICDVIGEDCDPFYLLGVYDDKMEKDLLLGDILSQDAIDRLRKNQHLREIVEDVILHYNMG